MEMVTRIRHAAWLTACVLSATVQAAGHEHGVRNGVQSLDVYADGEQVHLLTGEFREGSDKPVLTFARSKDGGATWSAAVRVDEGMPPAFSLHRGMDARIAAAGDHLIAVWMTAGTEYFSMYSASCVTRGFVQTNASVFA